MAEKLFLDYEHGKLCGLLSNKGGDSIVILCHGLASNKSSHINQALVPLLGSDGISSLAIDLYAHGESDGSFETLTVAKAYDGLKQAFLFAKDHGYEKVILTGSSFSGVVCLMGAQQLACDGLILKSPVFDYARLWQDRLGLDGIAEWKSKGYIELWKKKIGYCFYEQAFSIPIRQITSGVTKPALLVHGDNDELVPLFHSQEAYLLLAGEKKLHIVNGADHLYKNEIHFKELINVVHSWLKEKLLR